MILFSNPRSGTEWFLTGLIDYQYIGWELFNKVNDIPGTREHASFGNISFNTKIHMLQLGAETNKSFKIHFHDLHDQMQKDTWPVLYDAIKLHDHYKLTRNNRLEAVVSGLLAKYNNHNYHNHHSLGKTGIINRSEVEWFFNIMYKGTNNITSLFDYKETFVYEDLINNKQIPQSLGWDPSLSPIIKRNSMSMLNLIENKNEVLSWIIELIQDSQVQSQP